MKNTVFKFVRYEFFGLVAALALVLVLYVAFFLDWHLKRSLEEAAYEALGAEVNIAKVDVQLRDAKVKITGIQVTDFEKPERNIIEVEKASVDFSWEKLFYGSFVSPNANLEGIKFHSKRSSPGRLMPKEKRLVVLSDPSTNKVQDNLDQMYKKSNFADLIDAFDSKKNKKVFEEYKEKLKTLKLPEDLERQKNEIKSEIANIKDSKEIEKLKEDLKSYRFKSGSTQERLASINKASDLLSRVKKLKASLRQSFNSIDSKVNSLKTQIKTSPQQFFSDLNDLQSGFSLDQLKPSSISEDLLSKYFKLQVGQLGRVQNSLKGKAAGKYGKYIDPDKLPKKREGYEPDASHISLEKKKDLLLQKEGKTFVFVKEKSYPKYWFKKIDASSKASQGQDFGDVVGYIANLSESNYLIGKPLEVNLKGSVPKQGIGKFIITADINHLNYNKPKEKIKIDVSDYLIRGLELFSDPKTDLQILKSNSQTLLNLEKENDKINLELIQKFRKPIYDVRAKDENIQALLDEFKKQKPDLNLSLNASGEIDSPKIRLKSNLGDVLFNILKSGLTSRLKSELAKNEKLLKSELAEKLAPYTSELDVLNLNAKNYKTEITKALNKEIEKIEASKKEELKDKAKDALKKLFDRI